LIILVSIVLAKNIFSACPELIKSWIPQPDATYYAS
jgi:hypothetical protein